MPKRHSRKRFDLVQKTSCSCLSKPRAPSEREMEEEKRRDNKCFDDEYDLCLLLLLILGSSSHGRRCLGFRFLVIPPRPPLLSAVPCSKSTCLFGAGREALGIFSLLILPPQLSYPPLQDALMAAAVTLHAPASPNHALSARTISADSWNTSSMRCAWTLWKMHRAPHRGRGRSPTTPSLLAPRAPLPYPARPANFTTCRCGLLRRRFSCRDRFHFQSPLLELRCLGS